MSERATSHEPDEEQVEEEIEESFDAVVSEGAERLNRGLRTVLITGLLGGLEVALGVMGYLAVLYQTDSHLLAGFAFGIGLVAIYLAHGELFTEDFLLPIAALVSRDGTPFQLARLWIGTLLSNLLGGWLVMWLIAHAFPQYTEVLSEAAHHFTDAPLDLQAICLSVLAGSTMTLLTRMQEGTSSDVAKIFAAMAVGFLLAGLQLFHSILDSLLIFGAIHSGADVSYVDWLEWFGYVVPFNIIGGVVLVTALRLVRTKELVQEERNRSDG